MEEIVVSLQVIYPNSHKDVKRENESFARLSYSDATKIMEERITSIPEARFELRYHNPYAGKQTGVRVFNWRLGRFE
jgi:hypothetical protein